MVFVVVIVVEVLGVVVVVVSVVVAVAVAAVVVVVVVAVVVVPAVAAAVAVAVAAAVVVVVVVIRHLNAIVILLQIFQFLSLRSGLSCPLVHPDAVSRIGRLVMQLPACFFSKTLVHSFANTRVL